MVEEIPAPEDFCGLCAWAVAAARTIGIKTTDLLRDLRMA
jgi:hypothetical protein